MLKHHCVISLLLLLLQEEALAPTLYINLMKNSQKYTYFQVTGLADSFNPNINSHCIDRVPSFLQRLCNIEGKSCVTHSWVHSKWWTQWSWVVSCTAGPHTPPNWTGEICSHRMTCTHPPHPDRRSWPVNTHTHTHYRDILQIISSVIILPEKCFLWNPWKLFLSQKASLTWNNKEAQALIQ